MADQDARALLLTIQANTELLRSNLSAAERSIEEFTNKTQAHLDESDKRFEVFGKSIESLEGPLERLKSVGEFALGAVLGESLIETGKKALEFAGNVQFVSEQVGVSTGFLQKYRFAAGQFGVGTDDADTGLKKFARSIGEAANGNKTMIELFNRLGVNVRDAGGNVRSVESIFLDTANAVQKIDSPAQKTADTLALMGRGAAGLKPLLSEGAAGFNELAKAAEQLGLVLSPELISHSEEVNHKLAALKQVLNAQMAAAIDSNAGAIEGLATAVVKLAGGFAKLNQEHPGTTLGTVGALIGARIGSAFGPAGAVAGAAVGGSAGYFYGQKQAADDADRNTDPSFRLQQLTAANDRFKSDRRLRASSGGSLVSDGDYTGAVAELKRQSDLYKAALKAPHEAQEGLGSTGAGATNDSGKDLADAQAQLGHLQELQAHASGDALKGINEEIVQQKRKIAFIKQGADAELASSLASKQGAAQRKDETDARTAQHKAEEQRQKNLSDDIAYAGDVRKLREEILAGMRKTATNDAASDALQREGVNADADAAKAQNALKFSKGDFGSDAKVAQARLDNLNALVEQNRVQKLANVGIERQRENVDKVFAASQQDLANRTTTLQIEDSMATTAAARRKVELQLLDIQQQQVRAALQKIIDDNKDDDAVTAAKLQLTKLPAIEQAQRAQTINSTRGPAETHLRTLNPTKDERGELLQTDEVNAFQSLNSGLDQSISKSLKLHGIFGSIIQDLIDMAVKQALIRPLANSFFGGSSGGGGGLFGGLGKLLGLGGGGGGASLGDASVDPDLFLPGLASGGSFVVGGFSGIDKNILSINGEPTVRIGSGETIAVIPPTIPSARRIGQERQQSAQVLVHVAANDYFDAKVASISSTLDNRAAPHVAAAGAQLAGSNAARARRRSLV